MNKKRCKLVTNFIVIFIIINFFTRLALLVLTYDKVDLNILELLKVFSIGIFYDFIAVSYYLIPFIIYLIIIPDKIFNSKIHKYLTLIIYFLVIYTIIFNSFSEYFFWEEFGKRFNFIAVDYLVYTHEVIHNILESYPIPLLLTIIFFITVGIFYLLYKKTDLFSDTFANNTTFLERLKIGLIYLLLPIIFFNVFDKQSLANVCSNRYNQELAKDGLYSLFSAFRHNELDYYEFYKTLPNKDVLKNYKKLVGLKNQKFINQNTRLITKKGNEHKYNVILVMIESLSAEYIGTYGDKRGLTPHMDAIIKKSLFFNNLFATGTRTVRGMEAVTMSLPPTPGRSIVKRPDNKNMFGIGWLFKKRGYDNKFIYAGHGYFDNMNAYFGSNGFKIIDRLSFDNDEIHFSNVWGVCDEDLLDKVIKEADKSYKNKKPFFSFVMTTSNHRPYTYPDGKIDIPSHTGRYGGVKYTDYAINEFLQKAQKKPWFKNTIFAFVADHNGGSAGKTDLPLWRYKIPFIIYAPNIIKPKIVSKLSSQIDVAPTLLSILNWSYKSKFYGNDILDKDFKERALIGNYQKLGLYRDKKLTILYPNKTVKEFKVKKLTLYSDSYKQMDLNQTDANDTITYYQSASYFHKKRLDRIK